MIYAQNSEARSYGAASNSPQPLKKSVSPLPVVTPATRAVPRARGVHARTTITFVVGGVGLVLTLGLLTVYGRMCETREANRHESLVSELRAEQQLTDDLTLQAAKFNTDAYVTAKAKEIGFKRFGVGETITVTSTSVKIPIQTASAASPEAKLYGGGEDVETNR